MYALSLSPPPQKVTSEIYQDILQSLIDRMQKTIDCMRQESRRDWRRATAPTAIALELDGFEHP